MLNSEIQELTLLQMLTALHISARLDQWSPAHPRTGLGQEWGKEI